MLCEQAVRQHLAAATGQLKPFKSVSLRLSTDDETKVAPTLRRISADFAGSVGFGSYPVRNLHCKQTSRPKTSAGHAHHMTTPLFTCSCTA